MSNWLITSAGRRVKLVQYLMETLAGHGRVVAVDCDWNAPALYAADYRQLVPRIDDPAYIDCLLAICRHYEIKAVLSLIDPELSLLARQRERFGAEGIRLIVSEPAVVDTCFDKLATYAFLTAQGLPAVPTYDELAAVLAAIENQQLRYPLLAKPRTGSASLGIRVVENEAALRLVLASEQDLVVQPFYQELNEYGVDAYVDLISGQPISIFTKKKLRMRAGETERSLAVKDPALTTLIEQLLYVLGPIGPVDIDCFKVGERYLISEINPRFGGGYPHAYLAQQNFFRYLQHNLQGEANHPELAAYQEGSTMLKYDEIMLV